MSSRTSLSSMRAFAGSANPISRYCTKQSNLNVPRLAAVFSTPSALSPTRPAPFAQTSVRFAHSIPRPAGESTVPKVNTAKQPSYELTFTCVPCGSRSAHNISKQGYHHGTVLITCPSCRNRHVISDHLNIFGDRKMTVEDLMKERGQLVKRGALGEDGDLEFWEDGTTTSRDERTGEGKDPRPAPRQEQKVTDDAPGSSFGKA
ncbi:DNL zinc finger-domain-containing protein [Coniella lustricola]|uniref:DNL zinc finger-domain-containing protein n=1 Tax=Coniella lustricola TaxID=2025994 RepID=A0A2T3A937_9PEZI|nr:DNL zinc finger-domain-containing protein [Coniella lustricola]